MATPADRGAFDDASYPAYTMGMAAELLDVTPAFLRALGVHGLLHPGRSGGGHRRYSRDELDLAARARDLAAEGLSLAAACRIISLEQHIVSLEQQLGQTRADIATLQARLTDQDTLRGK